MIWSRSVAVDGAVAVDDDVVLDVPGEYADPDATGNPPLLTDRLPMVVLTTVADEEIMLAPDGRPMVVNLWYSTCPPCARELTAFAAVHADVGAAVRFVGVDPYDTASAMIRFAADRGVTYDLLRDPHAAFADELAVVAFPVTLFVDADGRILERTGPLDETELRERISRYWDITA